MAISSWFQCRTERPFRLFCFPYAGAGGTVYHSWQDTAPIEAEVIAVTAPGRLHRICEPSLIDFPSYVASLGGAVSVAADRPFAFFGHSLGALIAFEVARWLHAHTPLVPTNLIASACTAPSHHAAAMLKQRVLHRDDDLIEYLSKMHGACPPEFFISSELRAMGLAALRDDLALAGSYVYRQGASLPCPILALAGQEDSTVHLDDIRLWADETSASFDIVNIPGAHMFINSSASEVMRCSWSAMFRQVFK